ncbi:MAG: hypothetical protein ABI091_08680, partial [Ferruginibacter sp.]
NDDYAQVKARFIELCCGCGVTKEKIGFFGNVGFPGVSDLDAIVCDRAEKLLEIEILHKKELEVNRKYKFIFWHTPVFLPNQALLYASSLHTLNDLKFEANGLKLQKPSVHQLEVLHINWFVFLLWVISSIKKKYYKNKPTSLRLLLLVYKNLMYSNNVFCPKTNMTQDLLPADGLREFVKLHYDDLNSGVEKVIYDRLFNLFDLSLSNFDEYCKSSFLFKDQKLVENQSFLFMSFLLFCRKRNTGSSLKMKGGLVVMDLNPYAFQFVVDITKNNSNNLMVNDYINDLKKCKEICESKNISFPFMDSVPKSTIFFKRILLAALNKIVSNI